MLSPSLQRIAPSVGNARTAIVLDSSPAGIPGDGTSLASISGPVSTSRPAAGERLSGLSGDFDDIIANGSSAGKQYVQIAPNDVFSSQECSTYAGLGGRCGAAGRKSRAYFSHDSYPTCVGCHRPNEGADRTPDLTLGDELRYVMAD